MAAALRNGFCPHFGTFSSGFLSPAFTPKTAEPESEPSRDREPDVVGEVMGDVAERGAIEPSPVADFAARARGDGRAG
jgi:hypothetical protein